MQPAGCLSRVRSGLRPKYLLVLVSSLGSTAPICSQNFKRVMPQIGASQLKEQKRARAMISSPSRCLNYGCACLDAYISQPCDLQSLISPYPHSRILAASWISSAGAHPREGGTAPWWPTRSFGWAVNVRTQTEAMALDQVKKKPAEPRSCLGELPHHCETFCGPAEFTGSAHGVGCSGVREVEV